jgi:hypothetical protein
VKVTLWVTVCPDDLAATVAVAEPTQLVEMSQRHE